MHCLCLKVVLISYYSVGVCVWKAMASEMVLF